MLQKLGVAFGFYMVSLILMAWAVSVADSRLGEALANGDFAWALAVHAQFSTLRTAAIGLAAWGVVATIVVPTLIARPYVATARDFEALAAGDTDRPIARTDYKDCVGKLSRTMLVFRETAMARDALAERVTAQAHAHDAMVAALTLALRHLADDDADPVIEEPFPAQYEQLRLDFNASVAAVRTRSAQDAGAEPKADSNPAKKV